MIDYPPQQQPAAFNKKTPSTLITAQQLMWLPGHNTKFTELIRGVLHVGEPSGGASSEVAAKITILLGAYVLQHDLGSITGEAGGYVLERNPDTVRAPDIAFTRRERVSHGMPRTFFEGAPDLAVEVMSPSDNRSAVIAKANDYLAAGTPLVWVVDVWNRIVTVYRAGHPPETVDASGTLTGGDVVPGFTLDVKRILPPE